MAPSLLNVPQALQPLIQRSSLLNLKVKVTFGDSDGNLGVVPGLLGAPSPSICFTYLSNTAL